MRATEFINEAESEEISPELQQLIDIAEQTGNKMAASRELRYQLYMPKKDATALIEDIKPNAKLWTSTAIGQGKNTYTSEWAEWCHYNMPKWMSPQGSLYQVQPGAKVLNIGSDQAARKIALVFGKEFKLGRYEIVGKYPWEDLAKYFDAVRYPAKLSGGYASRMNNVLMSLWDVESTAWYNTDKLKPIGKVNIKVRGW